MKRGIGVLAAALMSTSAMAADLGVKAPVYASPAVVAPTWTGLYIGGNAGWIQNDVGADLTSNIPWYNGSVSQSSSGFMGGVQIGYNWQFGHFVIGAVTDYNLTSISTGGAFGVPGLESKLPWFGTSRLNLGLAYNQWLFYGTGGAAYGQEDINFNGGTTSLTTHIPAIGWTAGAGLKYMFPNSPFIVGAEYLHVEMKGPQANLGIGTFNANLDTHTNADVVRGLVEYKF